MLNGVTGYEDDKPRVQDRLRRIEGQVRGLQKMVDEDRYCIDVLTQISAIQAALDKVALGLLDDHARHCMRSGAEEGRSDEMTAEMMAAIGRLMKRGQSYTAPALLAGLWVLLSMLALLEHTDLKELKRLDGLQIFITHAVSRPGVEG